jgi:dCMP deaminase
MREKHHEWSLKNEVHAEANAICACAKAGISTDNSELYTTISPCTSCALLIVQAGIKKVYYEIEYDLSDGLDVLKNNNIYTEQIKEK